MSVPKIEYGAISAPKDFQPIKFGKLVFLGCKIPEDCRKLSERKIIYAETFWTVEKKITEDYLIEFSAIPERECVMQSFSQDISQGDDNPMWFTSNWTVGEVYKIIFALEMPPLEKIANADLILEICVADEKKICGVYRDNKKIEMRFSHTPYYNMNFPDSIYQNKIGQCWTAKQLADVTGGKWINPPPENFFVRSIVRKRDDLKNTAKPALYIAATYSELAMHDIYHEQETKKIFDSHKRLHRFSDEIAAAIVSRPVKDLPENFPQLLVEDTSRATFELAFASRERFQGKVIAVTGSNGKSTTVAMIKNILSKNNNIASTVGSRNAGVSIATAFANCPQRRAYAVLETSSVSLNADWGSITYGLKPNVAVVTSITDAHLLEHGTMEGVAQAKSKIFCGMSPGSYAVLNRDMPYYEIFERKANEKFLNIVSFGSHPDSTVRMRKIADGENFTFRKKSYKLNCPVPPDQIYDALAAIGVAVALSVPVNVAAEKLEDYKMLGGRDNLLSAVYKNKKLRVIDGSYNATFLSIKTGLEYLNSVEENSESRVIILGDIAHLGEYAETVHRQLADVILQNPPNRIFLCGKFMKLLCEDIKNKCNCMWFESGQKLIPELEKNLRDGDCVFVKGSFPAKLKLVVNEILGR